MAMVLRTDRLSGSTIWLQSSCQANPCQQHDDWAKILKQATKQLQHLLLALCTKALLICLSWQQVGGTALTCLSVAPACC